MEIFITEQPLLGVLEMLLSCSVEALPIFSLSHCLLWLSPLHPSQIKFSDVAKLQLVKAKYVTQQWPVTGAFFYFIFFTVT